MFGAHEIILSFTSPKLASILLQFHLLKSASTKISQWMVNKDLGEIKKSVPELRIPSRLKQRNDQVKRVVSELINSSIMQASARRGWEMMSFILKSRQEYCHEARESLMNQCWVVRLLCTAALISTFSNSSVSRPNFPWMHQSWLKKHATIYLFCARPFRRLQTLIPSITQHFRATNPR